MVGAGMVVEEEDMGQIVEGTDEIHGRVLTRLVSDV